MAVEEFNALRERLVEEKKVRHQQLAKAQQGAPAAEGDLSEPKPSDAAVFNANQAALVAVAEGAESPADLAATGQPSLAATPATTAGVPQEALFTVSEEEIRSAFFRLRDEYYTSARRELMLRKPYEDGIRRPYFHVKPLDAMQLYNWAKYLDAIEARGDHTATIMLFERCLVACASYPGRCRVFLAYKS